MAVEISAMGVDRQLGLRALAPERSRPVSWTLLARHFPIDPLSIGAARRAVEELTCLDPTLLVDLRLLVSELVANSVEHSPQCEGTPIGLTVSISTRRIRVEVDDAGDGFTPNPSRPPSVDALSGRGLFVVDQLAACWGVTGEGGTHVWCELERDRLDGPVEGPRRAPEAPAERTFGRAC